MKTYAFFLCAVLLSLSPSARAQDAGDGRYQMFFGPPSKAETYLLDTATGRTWALAVDEQGRRHFIELPVEDEANPKHKEFVLQKEQEKEEREAAAAGKAWAVVHKTKWYDAYKAALIKHFEGKAFKVSWAEGTFILTDPQGSAVDASKEFPDEVAEITENIKKELPLDYKVYEKALESVPRKEEL